MTGRNRVALVLTVLNEARSIDRLIRSIRAQTRPPDEIVIVDGGSRDGTPERIRALAAADPPLPLHLLELPGANISAGRNAAIGAATADLVAVTDAGVRLEPDWLERLTAPFDEPDPPDVVAGFFRPDLSGAPTSVFQTALAATILPAESDIDPARFLPSSRSVAFRRSAWAAAGGYPEWLDYGEDLVFDLTLRALGCRFGFEPRARVWFAPRESWPAFFVQYYRYARGDGKADLWRRRQAARYGAYLGALIALLAARRHPWLLIPGGLLGLAYCRRPAQRYLDLTRGRPAGWRLRGLLLVPLIRAWGDLAKMAGYPAGLAWRLRRRRTSG